MSTPTALRSAGRLWLASRCRLSRKVATTGSKRFWSFSCSARHSCSERANTPGGSSVCRLDSTLSMRPCGAPSLSAKRTRSPTAGSRPRRPCRSGTGRSAARRGSFSTSGSCSLKCSRSDTSLATKASRLTSSSELELRWRKLAQPEPFSGPARCLRGPRPDRRCRSRCRGALGARRRACPDRASSPLAGLARRALPISRTRRPRFPRAAVLSAPSSCSSSGLRSSSLSTYCVSSMFDSCNRRMACCSCGVITSCWPCLSSSFVESAMRPNLGIPPAILTAGLVSAR